MSKCINEGLNASRLLFVCLLGSFSILKSYFWNHWYKSFNKKTNRVHIFDRTHRLRSVCSLCSKFSQIIPEINKSNLSFLSQSGKIPPKSNAEMNVQVKKRLIYFLCSTQTVLMLRDLIFDDYKYRIKQVNQTAAPVLFCFFIINLDVQLFNGSFSDS